MQESVIKYLVNNGWDTNLKSKRISEHGVDIKVRNKKYSRYWLIEVKGDPKEKVKSPSGSRSSSFNSALGQILSRMHTKGKSYYKYRYKYGIAFSKYFEELVIRKLPHDVMNKLNLYVFIVDQKGVVTCYDWRKVKKIQFKMK